MERGKIIKLLFNNGSLKGVISPQESSWNKSELYSAHSLIF